MRWLALPFALLAEAARKTQTAVEERQRQRNLEAAMVTLQRAMEETAADARGVDAVEAATRAAAKLEARSETLAALVAVATDMVEQARAAEAERARVAAEAAEAVKAVAEAVAAAKRHQRLEEQAAALTLRVQNDMLALQQVQAQLGVPPAAPAPAPHPDDAEDQCVLCFDAPKDHIIIPCGHMCVCQACANQLTQMSVPSCPICRGAIQQTNKVFHS
jgi:hypothetical protein